MYGIDDHPGIGRIEGRGTEQAKAETPAIAPQRQTAVFGIQPGERVAVALQ
ncbi:hypothetical protein D3C80_2176600 [compost metagenome]